MLLREELLVTGSILTLSSPKFDLSVLLMLPLDTDSLVLRADIGLFEPLGVALLGGCFPLRLSLRGSTARVFSGYRAVLGARSLNIPVIWRLELTRHVILFAGGIQ